jgi:hypothetical protein
MSSDFDVPVSYYFVFIFVSLLLGFSRPRVVFVLYLLVVSPPFILLFALIDAGESAGVIGGL